MPKHPRTDFVAELQRPRKSAAELGYVMPGEFEPLDAVWLTFPRNDETWPGCFDKACSQYENFVKQLRKFVKVELIGGPKKLTTRRWKANDSWIRDYGPTFVI